MDTSSSHATVSVRLPSGLPTQLACAWQGVELQLTGRHGQALASWVDSCGNSSDGAVVYGTLHGLAGKHVVQEVMDVFVIGSAIASVNATANLSYTTSLGLTQSIVMPMSISHSFVDVLDGSSCRRLSELPRRLDEPLNASRGSLSSRQAWGETGRRLTQELLDINEVKDNFSTILEQGTVSVESVWESALNVLWSDVEIDLKDWAVNNIFALGLGIRSFDVRMSLADADGASPGSLIPMWSYDPAPAFQFAHVVQTYDDFLVDAAHRRVFPELVVRIDNDWETMARLYDEMVGHGRLCARLDAVATAYLQYPGQDAYVLEGLELEIPKLGMYGVDACGVEAVCEEVVDQIIPTGSESLLSFTMVNSAQAVGGAVRLASSTGDGGATWSVSKVAVVDSWAASFEFKVSNGCFSTWWGCIPTTGGHGFAFVLQSGPSNVAASSNDGGGGYSGIDDSIGVLLHTYASYSALYVYKNGRTAGGEELATAALPGGVDSGSWQSARIVYSSISGHMWVYIQDMDVALITLQIDMDFANADGQAHVGFTASNPWAEGWSTFEVQNLNFEGAATSVQHSKLAEDGLTIGTAGSTASFTVISYTSCDHHKLRGGDSWFFDLVSGAAILQPLSIRDERDGTFNVTFLATSSGPWTVRGATSPLATKQAIGTVFVS
ncbi:unnamed protein product [Prorocentrum cordatum]|uniref:Uncharacterized protein n=1 Tax=Prorocentrum cordatum TaxID=2364126 RepID=A0ABN9XMA5_9DINO|nr:unnamed protein product [Polarella glacialis]